MHDDPNDLEDMVSSGARGGSGYVKFEARLRKGKYRLVIKPPTEFSLDQAAKALATLSPEKPPHFGRKTCHRLLQQAGRQRIARRLSQRRLNQADPEMTAFYRDKLIEFQLFPKEAAAEDPSTE